MCPSTPENLVVRCGGSSGPGRSYAVPPDQRRGQTPDLGNPRSGPGSATGTCHHARRGSLEVPDTVCEAIKAEASNCCRCALRQHQPRGSGRRCVLERRPRCPFRAPTQRRCRRLGVTRVPRRRARQALASRGPCTDKVLLCRITEALLGDNAPSVARTASANARALQSCQTKGSLNRGQQLTKRVVR